jgi:hypothetical protein
MFVQTIQHIIKHIDWSTLNTRPEHVHSMEDDDVALTPTPTPTPRLPESGGRQTATAVSGKTLKITSPGLSRKLKPPSVEYTPGQRFCEFRDYVKGMRCILSFSFLCFVLIFVLIY